MAATPSGASAARVHFLSADSGLGKTTALADFARRASATGQPVGGLLCPVGPDGLRKMLSLTTGEQRALQVVPMTEADAATRSERLETTDARTRGTDSVSVTFISVAASASAAVSQSLCVVSVTSISVAAAAAAAASVAIAVSQSLLPPPPPNPRQPGSLCNGVLSEDLVGKHSRPDVACVIQVFAPSVEIVTEGEVLGVFFHILALLNESFPSR